MFNVKRQQLTGPVSYQDFGETGPKIRKTFARWHLAIA